MKIIQSRAPYIFHFRNVVLPVVLRASTLFLSLRLFVVVLTTAIRTENVLFTCLLCEQVLILGLHSLPYIILLEKASYCNMIPHLKLFNMASFLVQHNNTEMKSKTFVRACSVLQTASNVHARHRARKTSTFLVINNLSYE